MTRFPALFVSHGAPTVVLHPTPARTFLSGLGATVERACGRPRAIICISAHWETDRPAVGSAPRPATIHDFHGFPEPLYGMRYHPPGAPELARRIGELLAAAGLSCAEDPERGLDHGAWIPLKLMWPDADIPVLQVAIQHALGPAHHWRVGAALSPLRGEGVLILGSGGAVHNVGDAMRRQHRGDDAPPDWAVAFDAWLAAALARGDAAALWDYRRQAPAAATAHPRDEHLLPLFVAAGAAEGETTHRLHASFDLGSLSMAAWSFGDAALAAA